jgi:hypothetical protein
MAGATGVLRVRQGLASDRRVPDASASARSRRSGGQDGIDALRVINARGVAFCGCNCRMRRRSADNVRSETPAIYGA